jgi:hypothetical protein
MRRIFAVGVVVALLASAGVVHAAGPTINTDPKQVYQGYSVRVFGVVPGCARGNIVTLMSRAFSHKNMFAGVPAIFAEVRREHKYSTRTRIPLRRQPGRYKIAARCGGGNLGVTAYLRVLRY